MIDPEHVNDLKEMPVGYAARAAFLHAAEAEGMTEDSLHPIHLDFYSLLVLTVGEKCTDRDVSNALHLAGDRIEGSGDAVMIPYADWFVLKPTREGKDGDPIPIPVPKFVREAAASLASLNKFEPGERVLSGQDRETAVPGVIVGRGVSDGEWLVADGSGDEPRKVHFGEIWHVPLAQPTSLRPQ